MRTTGLGFSAFLIAIGAILAWAVTYEADGIDLNQVGVILFVVGIGLGLITLLAAAAGRRTTIDTKQDTVVDGRPVVSEQREVISERDSY